MLSYPERKAKALDLMLNQYAGRTAKFEKDGQIYIENIFSGELILKYEISTLQEISALFSIGFTGLFFILLKKDKLTNKKRAH